VFTGIVEELGEVVELTWKGEGARLAIRGPVVTADAAHGDSISVNGVCLTVVENLGETFTTEVMKESFDRSSLGGLQVGDRVNLERAVKVSDRLGGHIVQGHVDGVGTVRDVRDDGFARIVTITAAPNCLRYVVEKGSIAVDGVSLTVSAIDERSFSVSLIPETLERTTLGTAEPGRPVNLEVDVLAKYVEKLIA
jgi:riboflavin synthase